MFGIAGIFSTIRPRENVVDKDKSLMLYSLLFGFSSIILLPILNLIPFNFDKIGTEFFLQLFYFTLLYGFLSMPFFFAGIIFTSVFSIYASKIRSLYFFDLVGASLGSFLIIPLIPKIGPGGILFVVGGLSILAAILFIQKKIKILPFLVISFILIAIPFVKEGYFEFKEHVNKRHVVDDKLKDKLEFSYWDPVSKIDVIDQVTKKHVAYDGGSQSSTIFPFDGNYKKLRSEVFDSLNNHFWNRGVLASHYLRKDSGSEVLIIGSAAGQETKAALLFGASKIDAVEMVGIVMEISKNIYSNYNGNIFNDSRVNKIVGEGRSFLRATDKKYDIIQIYSNHTSSSIAAGTGAMATTYLQTAEAYKEYFISLKRDGILHINHHVLPKMITTAAKAWKELNLGDFEKHVVAFQMKGRRDNLPTLLIKMTPWIAAEIDTLNSFFSRHSNEKHPYEIILDPINSKNNYLSKEFFSGTMTQELLNKIPYRVVASTDNRPYFNFLRKHVAILQEDSSKFVDKSTAAILNEQLRAKIVPMDTIHLFLVGIVSLLFSILFIFIPLKFAAFKKSNNWHGAFSTLSYFACLGSGFIIFELTFIQIFMKLIGNPLYTYSTILFAMLLSAGIGSLFSEKLNITPLHKWQFPFLGIIISSLLIILFHQQFFYLFLSSPIVIRILVSVVLIFPLGFFLGMPFPLGISTIKDLPKGTIAWAWALNGLFTTIGGLLSVLLSIYWGFKETVFVAMIFYILAFILFSRFHKLTLKT